MNLRRRLFGGASGAGSFADKDNLGTRHSTSDDAIAYWAGARMGMSRKDPFVLFSFDREEDAKRALLELPCIHVASDSKKLICTETLIFGCYEIGGGYEAIICGDDLSVELWEQATESFTRHGGRRKNDLEPTKRQSPPKPEETKPDEVVFVREDIVEGDGDTCTYRVYKGPNAGSAQAFLSRNPVTRNFLYLAVETPDGNYCRDIKGIYKE